MVENGGAAEEGPPGDPEMTTTRFQTASYSTAALSAIMPPMDHPNRLGLYSSSACASSATSPAMFTIVTLVIDPVLWPTARLSNTTTSCSAARSSKNASGHDTLVPPKPLTSTTAGRPDAALPNR